MLHTLEQGWRSKAPGGGGRSEATCGWGRSEARDHSCTYDPEGSRYVLWAISWEPHLGAIDADRSKNQLFFSIFRYDLQILHGRFLHRSWIFQKLANFVAEHFANTCIVWQLRGFSYRCWWVSRSECHEIQWNPSNAAVDLLNFERMLK